MLTTSHQIAKLEAESFLRDVRPQYADRPVMNQIDLVFGLDEYDREASLIREWWQRNRRGFRVLVLPESDWDPRKVLPKENPWGNIELAKKDGYSLVARPDYPVRTPVGVVLDFDVEGMWE